MECKDCSHWCIVHNQIRINRNIVECKVQMRVHSQAWGHSINRNIVECKGFFFRAEFKSDSVLIETSWNVKYHSRPAHDRRRTVLIETSWNVKVFVNCSLLFAHGINRNIVECKDQIINFIIDFILY